MLHTSEVSLILEKPKPRPPLPMVKGTISITNKVTTRPSIPTVNETISLDKSCEFLSFLTEILIQLL